MRPSSSPCWRHRGGVRGGLNSLRARARRVAVLVGAGDIAVCGAAAQWRRPRLDGLAGTVFVQANCVSDVRGAIKTCYDTAWGRQKIARPTPATTNPAAGRCTYFAYFGANAGPPAAVTQVLERNWQYVAESTLSRRAPGSSNARQRDGAGGDAACTVGTFTPPSATAPEWCDDAVVSDFWRALYAGADVIISAHEHFYERFAPQTPAGMADPRFGIRQFIVGTGGAPLTQPVRRVANSEAVLSAFGVLRLTLDTQSYRWEFLSSEGGAILDAGSGQCHGKPSTGEYRVSTVEAFMSARLESFLRAPVCGKDCHLIRRKRGYRSP